MSKGWIVIFREMFTKFKEGGQEKLSLQINWGIWTKCQFPCKNALK